MLNLVLGLLLQFSLALAAPVSTQSHHGIEPWHYGVGGGVIGFVIFILDIICFIEVLQSNRSVPDKVIWCALVFFFPVIGMIIYYLFSNRHQHNRRGYEIIP